MGAGTTAFRRATCAAFRGTARHAATLHCHSCGTPLAGPARPGPARPGPARPGPARPGPARPGVHRAIAGGQARRAKVRRTDRRTVRLRNGFSIHCTTRLQQVVTRPIKTGHNRGTTRLRLAITVRTRYNRITIASQPRYMLLQYCVVTWLQPGATSLKTVATASQLVTNGCNS